MRRGITGGTLVAALFLLVMPISTLSYSDTWTGISCLDYDDSWTEMNPVIAPSGRCDTPLVYDSQSDVVIVFGGGRGSDVGMANDTWAYSYESDTWYNKSPAVAPDSRVGHMLAYDSESKIVIMFSGVLRREDLPIGHVCYDETWEYNYSSNTWTNLEPATVPTPRCYGAMAYDEEADRVILFGGILEGTTVAADTWAYDYNANTWENMNPATRPSARFAAAMAYNSAVDKMILTGGTSDGEIGYTDTWSYDYDTNTWTNLNPSKPPPEPGMHMVYDVEDDICIFFGEGTSTETKAYNYTSNSWRSLTHQTHPPWREQAAVAYDADSDVTILFGGKTGDGSVNRLNDTWAYDYNAPPPVTTTTTIDHPPPPIVDPGLLAIGAGAIVLVLAVIIYVRRQR